jgi:hypothetical protein
MCWNKDISLNTFLFSSFVLLLIMYNNTYTKYKIKEFDNIWMYIFFISFILMQLIEYFIWINLNVSIYNNLFTTIAKLLIFFQPIATTMLITNNHIRSIMLSLYLIIYTPLGIYRLLTQKKNSTITPFKHLNWNLQEDNSLVDNILGLGWFIFFLFPLFYEGRILGLLFGILTLAIMSYYYLRDGSVSSMWCWIVNSIMVYYAAYLLLYLPFFT